MSGDDDHGGVRIGAHDVSERVQPLATVGLPALEVEVEENGVGAFAFHHRKELGRRLQSFDSIEHVAEREASGERHIGIVIDDNG